MQVGSDHPRALGRPGPPARNVQRPRTRPRRGEECAAPRAGWVGGRATRGSAPSPRTEALEQARSARTGPAGASASRLANAHPQQSLPGAISGGRPASPSSSGITTWSSQVHDGKHRLVVKRKTGAAPPMVGAKRPRVRPARPRPPSSSDFEGRAAGPAEPRRLVEGSVLGGLPGLSIWPSTVARSARHELQLQHAQGGPTGSESRARR